MRVTRSLFSVGIGPALFGASMVLGSPAWAETELARLGISQAAITSSTPEPLRRDIVQNDDLIVRGKLCAGIDCVNGEGFLFDTLRLKEQNTRIRFHDSSTAAGFPTTDWQLTANDSMSGGLNRFSIEDLSAGTTPFTVLGGAPSNSLFVSSQGRVNIGGTIPSFKLQVDSASPGAEGMWILNVGGGESLIMLSTFVPGGVAQTWSTRSEVNGDLAFINVNTGTAMMRLEPGGAAPDRLVVHKDGVRIQGELTVNGAPVNLAALARLIAERDALERRLAALEARLAALPSKTPD